MRITQEEFSYTEYFGDAVKGAAQDWVTLFCIYLEPRVFFSPAGIFFTTGLVLLTTTWWYHRSIAKSLQRLVREHGRA